MSNLAVADVVGGLFKAKRTVKNAKKKFNLEEKQKVEASKKEKRESFQSESLSNKVR